MLQEEHKPLNLCEYCDLSNDDNKCNHLFDYFIDTSECTFFCIDEQKELPASKLNTLVNKVDTSINKYDVCENEIVRPSHYGNFTPIDAMGSGLISTEKFKGFLIGNFIKYITRYEYKNGLEDLHKAQEYLRLLISVEDGTYKVGE